VTAGGNSIVYVTDISNGTANSVLGTDSSGNGTTLSLGANLTLSGGTLDAIVPAGSANTSVGLIHGNGTAQRAGNLTLVGAITGSGNGATSLVTTIPLGNAPLIRASGDLTAQSGNAVLATYTVGAANGTFEIAPYATITAVVTDVLQIQTAYTDETSTARVAVSFPMGLTSAGLTATGASQFPAFSIRAKTGTTITTSANLTTSLGTIAYDAGVTILQLR
jgi:hypothetical protein